MSNEIYFCYIVLQITTPKQKLTDEIFFASGNGPDCYSPDDEQCIPTETDPDDDSLFTPTITITRRPEMETDKQIPYVVLFQERKKRKIVSSPEPKAHM